jgi:hypothetical protein
VTAIEQSLLEALRDLDQAAGARPSPSRPPILPLLERLDRLAAELPADAPAQLRHFLERKSYGKARLLLESRAGGA